MSGSSRYIQIALQQAGRQRAIDGFYVSMFPLMTYLLTYLSTSWSRVFLEKLNDSQLFKKFPVFDGTRKFITAFTCPYPEPSRTTPCTHIPLPEDSY
jgi:hypothetical protein